MALESANALLFFDQHSPHLISARFQAKARQHLIVFSAYSPTNCKDGGVRMGVLRRRLKGSPFTTCCLLA
jgi:hypothetical protein